MAERKTQPKTPVKAQEKAVVKWKGKSITISFHDVKTLICPYATDQETIVFLKTCQSLQLNPFANEIYLIKYSDEDKAATVIDIHSYLKSAETNDNFNGFEAGIVLRDSGGKLEFREGSLLLADEAEKLAGGYARVFRKDREKPFYIAVSKAECLRHTKSGSLTRFWAKEKQPMMLRKTALKRALVEAFPSLFAGTMSTSEVAEIPEVEYEEMPEGELPPAYERNSEPYWKLWWVRQKEKGLDEEDVHDILSVTSVKKDWLETGRTLEEAEDIINQALPLVTRAKELGLSINQVNDMLGMALLKEWFSQGKTVEEAVKIISDTQPAVPSAAQEITAGSIDLQWLTDATRALKWTDNTMLSFITSQYKVSAKSIPEALNQLHREQAEHLVNQITHRLEKQPSLL